MQLVFLSCIARTVRAAFVLAATAALASVAPSPSMAQNLFKPAILVDDAVITHFELEQREQLLRLLRAPGDPAELAREALIEDRIKERAVEDAGIELTPEDVKAGIEEFASRTNLSGEEFLRALTEGGVSPETMRDFTEVSLAWRELIRGRFLERARPSDREIERALGRAGSGGGVQVLLSEIVIPITAQTIDQVEVLAQEISQYSSQAAFGEAARKYSASETAGRGGRMNWISINNLPPGLRPVVLALNPGETSAPLAVPQAVVLFHMRAIREGPTPPERYSAIEYAAYYIPGGRTPEALSKAVALRDTVDNCNDLYGVAKDQPPEVLDRKSQAPGEIPADIALELAKLDEGEVSTALTRSNGQNLMFLMLCGRTAELNDDVSREQVANALIQQRLAAFSDSLLAQLRADALIIEK